MPKTRPFSQLAAPINADPVRRARTALFKRAMRDAMTLVQLREAKQACEERITFRRPAAPLSISPLDDGEDLYLTSLADYVAANSGRLELVAVFPDGAVGLTVPSAVAADEAPSDEAGESNKRDNQRLQKAL